mmetsp:Transcript_133496/g.231008  ORF Transcript_133496/g.231008 Transcript_133496/m.231008 type:complete len:120 (+) Transcript_133496:321-680(+)
MAKQPQTWLASATRKSFHEFSEVERCMRVLKTCGHKFWCIFLISELTEIDLELPLPRKFFMETGACTPAVLSIKAWNFKAASDLARERNNESLPRISEIERCRRVLKTRGHQIISASRW